MTITAAAATHQYFASNTAGDLDDIFYYNGITGKDLALAKAADDSSTRPGRSDGSVTRAELTAFLNTRDTDGRAGLQSDELAMLDRQLASVLAASGGTEGLRASIAAVLNQRLDAALAESGDPAVRSMILGPTSDATRGSASCGCSCC